MKSLRRLIQFFFLALTLIAVFLVKGNAERWCPFGGVEAAYAYFTKGNMVCSLGVSNLYILFALLLLALVVRRAFCGYVCPLGALSEWMHSLGHKLGVKSISVPSRVDWILRKLKYVVLAIILYFTISTGELVFRKADPCYALISRHGEDITFWAYFVLGSIVLLSVLIIIPFCRWFCPLAAVLNLFSRFGLARIRRSDACIHCGKCARACPMNIPVDKLKEVTSSRCTSCMNCLDVCPEIKRGALSWGPPQAWGKAWPKALVVPVIILFLAGAVVTAYMIPLPSATFDRGDISTAVELTTMDMKIEGVDCHGGALLLFYFLTRDDLQEVPGYLKLECWPGPGLSRARITYDTAQCNEEDIRIAITEPYYVLIDDRWRVPPFKIEGYDPLSFGLSIDEME